MGKLLIGMMTVILVFVLATLFLGSATVRFDLIAIKPAFWCFLFGIIFVLGGGWLAAAEVPAGGLFATLGAVLLLLGGYKSVWPNTSAATSHAQEVADAKAATLLNRATAPKSIPCDRTSGTKFWDAVTGKAAVFYALNTKTHRIDCADGKGFDPVTRQQYKEVIPEIVELILNQEPLALPAPVVVAAVATPMPMPTPTPAPTPLPDISDEEGSDFRPTLR